MPAVHVAVPQHRAVVQGYVFCCLAAAEAWRRRRATIRALCPRREVPAGLWPPSPPACPAPCWHRLPPGASAETPRRRRFPPPPPTSSPALRPAPSEARPPPLP